MDELVGAETIRNEILEEGRKKAEKILSEAESEAEREVSAIEDAAAKAVEEVIRENEAKAARYRMETMARFPLERTRLRAVFVDRALREAARAYIDALNAQEVARLSESMLASAASFFAGRDVELRRRGLEESAAKGIASRCLPGAASVRHVSDNQLPMPGLVAVALDGSLCMRATMDLVEERLLDEDRGELAKALCADALDYDASITAPPRSPGDSAKGGKS